MRNVFFFLFSKFLCVCHDFNEVNYFALVFGVAVEVTGAADGRRQPTTDDNDGRRTDGGRTMVTDDDGRRRTTTTDEKRRRSGELRAIPDFNPRATETQMTPDNSIG